MPKIKIVFWGWASFFSVIPQISLRGRTQDFLSGISEVSLLLGSSLISRFLQPKEVFRILRGRKAVLFLVTYFPKFVAHFLSHFCSPRGYVFEIPMAGRNLIFSAICHHIPSLNKLAWFGGLCREGYIDPNGSSGELGRWGGKPYSFYFNLCFCEIGRKLICTNNYYINQHWHLYPVLMLGSHSSGTLCMERKPEEEDGGVCPCRVQSSPWAPWVTAGGMQLVVNSLRTVKWSGFTDNASSF